MILVTLGIAAFVLFLMTICFEASTKAVVITMTLILAAGISTRVFCLHDVPHDAILIDKILTWDRSGYPQYRLVWRVDNGHIETEQENESAYYHWNVGDHKTVEIEE